VNLKDGLLRTPVALSEEKTRNGILSTLRIRGELGSAVALDDIQDGVLAQPEPMTYFPVRLAFVDKALALWWRNGRP
jgi:hypothetical protein